MHISGLPKTARSALQATARELIDDANARVPGWLEEANRVRRERGLPDMFNDGVASLAEWPPRRMSLSADRPEGPGELIVGVDGRTYWVRHGPPGTYIQARTQAEAALLMLTLLVEHGLDYRALPKFGFLFTYGVAVLIFSGENVLIGVRDRGVTNYPSRLGLPSGIVRPGEGIAEAAVAEVFEELPGLVSETELRDHLWRGGAVPMTFCADPSGRWGAFVCGMELPSGAQGSVEGNAEWQSRRLIWVPCADVLSALRNDPASLARCLSDGGLLPGDCSFTPDAAPAIRAFLEHRLGHLRRRKMRG